MNLDPGTNEVVSDDDEEEEEIQLKDTPASEATPNNTDIQNKVITTRDNGVQEQHVDPLNTQNSSDVTSNKKTFNEKFNLADIPQEIINQILIGKSRDIFNMQNSILNAKYFRPHLTNSRLINHKYHIQTRLLRNQNKNVSNTSPTTHNRPSETRTRRGAT